MSLDLLYYSNYCKYCGNVIDFLVKSNLVNRINFICIDKRTIDKRTGQLQIILENGKTMLLPPNIHEVPALLVQPNLHVITGNDIIKHYQPIVEHINTISGEPNAFILDNRISEQYSVLSGDTSGQYSSFVSADHRMESIRAEPDTWRPNKISGDVTTEQLKGYRTEEIKKLTGDDTNQMLSSLTATRQNDMASIVGGYTLAPKI
jgi:hypothetical protein